MERDDLSIVTLKRVNPPPLDERFIDALYKGLVEAVAAVELGSRSVVYWNEGAETLFKFPAKEILHQSMERLFSNRAAAGEIFAAALPQVEKAGFWRGECEYRRRDGSTFMGATTQSRLRAGGENYLVVTVRDISESKEREHIIHWLNQQLARRFNERASELIAKGNELANAENQRRQTERLLEILMRNLTNSAILFLGTDGRVTHSNTGSGQLLGYGPEEIEGIHLSQLFKTAAADAEPWETLLAQATRPNGVRSYDWLLRKNGSHFYARLELLPLRGDGDLLDGYLVLVRDDTEQRKIREQLREREHLATIGTATAMLAHEIRNPLNGMSTTVQFLERSLQSNFEFTQEMVFGTVQDLKNEIARLQTLLGDFHVISHPQQVNSRQVDLAGIIRGLVSLVVPESLDQKIEIVEQLEPDLPPIWGDPDKLKQVFLNLIKNAFEAMPNGGTLTAKAYATADGVCVEIADTGAGIAEDLNVFDLFRSTKAHGTGLGLPIARQIVLAHNGSIDYTSRTGEETVFRVVLPEHDCPPGGDSRRRTLNHESQAKTSST
jgi:PAS domain S-box-containing protein